MSKQQARRSKQELIGKLGELIRISQNRTIAFDRAVAARMGINVTDLHCLDVIERLGGATAGDVARELNLTTGAVTAVVDRLEEAGYARRTRDERDRRRVIVKLTKRAIAESVAIYGRMAADWETSMRRFTVEQLELLISFMSAAEEFDRRQLERLEHEP